MWTRHPDNYCPLVSEALSVAKSKSGFVGYMFFVRFVIPGPHKAGAHGAWMSESPNRQRPPKPLDDATVPGAERLANAGPGGNVQPPTPPGPRSISRG